MNQMEYFSPIFFPSKHFCLKLQDNTSFILPSSNVVVYFYNDIRVHCSKMPTISTAVSRTLRESLQDIKKRGGNTEEYSVFSSDFWGKDFVREWFV